MSLDPSVRDFVTDANFAALTTLFSDGSPQTQVMWVDADDDHVLINTEVERTKFRNIERDPRVTVTVWDHDNPYRYVEVRGEVAEIVRGEEAREHLDATSRRYTGQDWQQPIGSDRAILRITPTRVRRYGV